MEKKFTVYGIVIDQTKTDQYDSRIKEIFGMEAKYHLFVTSDALRMLVDTLGGISVKGKKVDGEAALALLKENALMEVAEGVYNALSSSGKNLVLQIPGLLAALKDTYATDMPLMDVVKTALGEISDLKKWKADYCEIDAAHADQAAALAEL